MESGGANRPKRLRVRMVRGEPYDIDGRRLTPVARVVSFGRAWGTIGTDRVGGRGVGFVRIKPVAMIEETPEGEQELPIIDATATALRKLLVAAVASMLVLASIGCLVRRWRSGKQ